MTKTASGRAALILAIGLLLGLAGPSQAADTPPSAAAVVAPGAPADSQAAGDNQTTTGSDQLNDSGSTAHQDDLRTPVVVTQPEASQPPPAVHSPVVAGSQNATWDETSLIGKIFIGFGALLTLASAARMFMA